MAEENTASRLPNSDPLQDERTCTADRIDLLTKDSLAYLKNLLEDDFYKALQRHFLMQGKGRRPNLPHKDLTNGLILQLLFLREEANASFREVKSWLEKLVPSTSSVTESRISHRMTVTLNSCLKMTQDHMEKFVQEDFDFHTLSPPLAALQLNRLHLTNVQTYHQPPLEDITNDVVISLEHFRSCENENPIFVRKWLKVLSLACSKLSDSVLRSRVQSALKMYKDLTRKKKTNDLNRFLKENFIIKLKPNSSQANLVEDNDMFSKHCSELKEIIRQKEIVISAQEKEKAKLVNDVKELVTEQRMKDEILKELQEKKGSLMLELSEARRDIISLKKERRQLLQQNLNLTGKLNDITNTKLYYTRNIELKKENDALKKELKDMSANIAASENLQQKVKCEQTMKNKYKKEKDLLKDQVERCLYSINRLEKDDDLNLKEKCNAYSSNVRQLYMSLIGEANVVPAQASKTVQLVAKHLFDTDLSLKDLPCPSTCLNFMDEAHHIAKCQIAENLQTCSHFTLASDGTSRQKKHFMEHHVVLNNGATLSIGYSEVPDDKAETLFNKSIDLLEELTDTYCESQEQERTKVFTDILNNMKCLMSDRASNMKLFNRKMLDYKKDTLGCDAGIEFLYCNAHFLIALATAAEKAILNQEKNLDEKLGRDSHSAYVNFSSSESSASRLIRTAADVFGPRGDEKNGCREEWLTHCDSLGIKSKYTSYRSNRFNNLFENAVAVLGHKSEALNFLQNRVSHSNLKLQSICLDIQDERIIALIQALALFSIFVATPYWGLMNSKTPYGQFPKYVKNLDAALVRWSEDDFPIEEIWNEIPIFGEFSSIIERSLFDFTSSHLTSITFKLICKESTEALRRQLKDFLPGGVYGGDLPSEIQQLLDACPLTNLTGERMFGDLDYDMVKRRRASTHLYGTLNMWKHNKTGRYLEKKSQEVRRKIMSSAKKHGKKLKIKHKAEVKSVKEAIKRRLFQNENERKEKELKDKDRQAALLTDLLAQGGLSHTKDDLDKLMRGPRPLHKLKIEMRFRKYYMQATDLRLSGNLHMLYRSLCDHLGFDYDIVLSEPPRKKRKIQDNFESDCSDSTKEN